MEQEFASFLEKYGEIGFVTKVTQPLIYANGLPGAKLGEIVMFENGAKGIISGLEEKFLEILNLTSAAVKVGSRLARSGEKLKVPVGKDFLGKIIDPLGRPLGVTAMPGKPAASSGSSEIIYRDIISAPVGITGRKPVSRALSTGVSVVDLLAPLGKGQREVVLGDRKSGKTQFLISALLSQVEEGAVGIYCIIGKSKGVIRQTYHALFEVKNYKRVGNGIIMIASSAEDPASMIYTAPYTAMTMAEYFRDLGHDVVLVLDDMTTHAKVYREISLLGRHFPGRNLYPGDIFSVHAAILERAGSFVVNGKEAAITCLPVAETAQGDLVNYIVTNLMSMTDGHLFFDYDLFLEGRRPALNPFISVTRVGHQVQTPLKRDIGIQALSLLNSASKLRFFAKFGAELNESVRETLKKEEQIIAIFEQDADVIIQSDLQLILFGFFWSNLWKDKTQEEIKETIAKLRESYDSDQTFRTQAKSAIDRSNSVKALVANLSLLNKKYV